MLATTGAKQLIRYVARQVTDDTACFLVSCQHATSTTFTTNSGMQVIKQTVNLS